MMFAPCFFPMFKCLWQYLTQTCITQIMYFLARVCSLKFPELINCYHIYLHRLGQVDPIHHSLHIYYIQTQKSDILAHK